MGRQTLVEEEAHYLRKQQQQETKSWMVGIGILTELTLLAYVFPSNPSLIGRLPLLSRSALRH